MREIKVIPEQKFVELENIEIAKNGKLSLKLLAYPVENQAYHGRLAFVVYYEYQTRYGSYNNFDKKVANLDRFLIDENHNLNDLSKSGELALILRSPSYRDIRFEIIQDAIFNSVKQKPLKSSLDNIKWFNENRGQYSKSQIGSSNFTRNKKRLKPTKEDFQKIATFIADKVTETPFVEIPTVEEAIEVDNIKEVEAVVTETQPLVQTKAKQLIVKTPANLKGKSSGLLKFIKKHAA